ncbi:phage tail tape measure protein, TP901 family, core region [Serratia quinivorans]|uniref:phage tail tape measure protein n=1 Tax=Serratia quinivorans TaxID=137545 RepID=UPI002179A9ED|nr:phage tail tape measure protein [Serratia quinivorans]CAI2062872.1 phage tail tape measure protein, TP901 family, core region [Serratia quinivorans]
MKQLEVMLSLVDKFSQPLKQAGKGINRFANQTKAGLMQVGAGAAGLWGAGQAIKGFLGPAYDMNRALGEVRSLGVAEKSLSNLSDAALMFSMQYGGSAADVVRSSYDIQSAIAGLQGNELSDFTVASGVLAKATKADTAVITKYMGTMYGIFQNTADAMGRSNWVKQIAGQTAEAVRVFKTSGNDMSAAFTTLGAAATSSKIDIGEQMAVLGMLQATMSGSEAGTKYKAFLAGVGSAQKALGLSFTNTDGSMKSVVDIMGLIQKKYGDLSKVADSDLIKKAFGSDEAVAMVKLLATNTAGLKENIDSLGRITGMKNAENMAKSMVDIWERLNAIWEGSRIIIGRTLIPVLDPLLQKVAAAGMQFAKWMKMFPNIARWLGYITLAILSLTAVGALATMMIGIARVAWAGFIVLLKLLRPLLFMLRLAFFLTGLAVNFMSWPLLLIIGVIALLAAGIWALITYWDELKAAIMNTAAFQWLMGIVDQVGAMFSSTWEIIKEGWQNVVNFFMGLSPVQAFTDFKNTITDVFKGLWDYLKNSFAHTYNWIVDKLNMIPGVDIEMKNVAPEITPGGTQPGSAPLLTGGSLQSTGRGGIMGQVSQSTNNSNSAKTQNISTINFNVAQPLTPQALQENMELYGHG